MTQGDHSAVIGTTVGLEIAHLSDDADVVFFPTGRGETHDAGNATHEAEGLSVLVG